MAPALLFEMRVAPMRIYRGAGHPDEITLRLKQTPMNGGLLELPTGGRYAASPLMLRSADHQKPLINAISTFARRTRGKSRTWRGPPISLRFSMRWKSRRLLIW